MQNVLSSPEKMDYSEESSFEELPQLGMNRKGPCNMSWEETPDSKRRVSCPPKINSAFSVQVPWALKRTISNASHHLGDNGMNVNTLGSDMNSIQLGAHYGRGTVLKPDNDDACSSISRASSQSSLTSSFFTGRTASEMGDVRRECSDSDSDGSTLTCHSTSTVRNVQPTVRMRQLGQSNGRKTIQSYGDKSFIAASAAGDQSDVKSKNLNVKNGVERNKGSKCGSCIKCVLKMFITLVFCFAVFIGVCIYVDEQQAKCDLKLPDITLISKQLYDKVYGQHVVLSSIESILREFYSKSSQKHTLVLSFHGGTGVGKNYVSSILTSSIPDAHVTKLIIPLHFPHERESALYGEQIQDWIQSNISSCANNLFIIDEVDKANSALIHGIKLILNRLKENDHMNTDRPSKAVIILLSNSGSMLINSVTLQHILAGKPRQFLTSSMFYESMVYVPESANPPWYKELTDLNLIDVIVPFLPLQREHVEMCVRSHIGDRNQTISDKIVRKIVDDFDYFPTKERIFAKAGCKRVLDFTALHLE